MDESKTRVDVGRVIFRQDCWVVQTLRSHVENVARLAEMWDSRRAFQGVLPDLERTRKQVVQAALIHDMAKPAHFHLEYKLNRWRKWEWSYSFRGHRFNAFHDDAYVQVLAQLHHTYSVDDIARHIAWLKLDKATATIAENLPLDLYTLEMCDQIEATFASAVLGSHDPEERVFMDFQFRQQAEAEYALDPFAFAPDPPITFSIEYVELTPPAEARRAVEGAPDDDRRKKPLREMEKWLLGAIQTAPSQYREVSLWPWTQ